MLDRTINDVDAIDALARAQINRLVGKDDQVSSLLKDKGAYISCAEDRLNKYRPSESVKSVPLLDSIGIGPTRSFYRSSYDGYTVSNFDNLHKRIATAVYRKGIDKEVSTEERSTIKVAIKAPGLCNQCYTENELEIQNKNASFHSDIPKNKSPRNNKPTFELSPEIKKQAVALGLTALVRLAASAVDTWARDNRVPFETLF